MMFEYIKSDLVRYTGEYSFKLLISNLFRNRSFKYSFWLRLANEHNSHKLCRFFARQVLKHLSNKYGIQIPANTQIGYGLYIGHHMSIVVNPTTVIGNNVNLSQFTTIGSNYDKAAVIGDNVYIGPSVCIVEHVKIASNVTIGAGSVVTRDIPENATVAGVPAKVLSYDNPGRHVNKRYIASS